MFESIQEMNLVEYLEHLKEISDSTNAKESGKKINENEISKEETSESQEVINNQIDNFIVEQKIIDLMDMKNVDKHIRYKIRF